MSLPVLAACLLLAGVMGFAIQRGATCTVAAVDEIVERRGCSRLIGMLEAALWVLGGLLIWRALHGLATMPAGYAVSAATIAGGVLLGLGAFVNGACVFGTVARLGSGEWAYGFTPLGFYLGCLVALRLAPAAAQPLEHGSPVLGASAWWIVPLAAYMAWRLLRPWFDPRAAHDSWRAAIAQRVWSPRAATTVIGITFLFLLLAAGAWAYTDVLAELARSMMAGMLTSRALLLLALLLGAIAGGRTAGCWHATAITPAQALRCLAGGALMGYGSLLIPGGNDGLILLGMPLLWPYAWLAFATMCASIAVAMLIRRRVVK